MPTAPKEVRPGLVDWSTVHEPVTDTLFTPVQETSEWKKFQLDQSQVDQFWRDGFLLNIPILTPQQCDLILEDYSILMEPDKKHQGHELLYFFSRNQSGEPDNVLMHALGHWRLTQLFHDLVWHPKVVVPCSQLVVEGQDHPVRFWHDQAFAKPPKHGGVVAWHQDYSYWTRTQPCMHVTVHIALDEQTEENGTLLYIPGSHRWTRDGGKPLPVLDFNFKDMEGIKTILTPEELAAFKPKASMLKKGHASFHHSYSVHGSYGNRSDQVRRSAVLNYFGDGVISNTDGPMLMEKVEEGDRNPEYFAASNIPKGEMMEGQFYPLVYDPKWAL